MNKSIPSSSFKKKCMDLTVFYEIHLNALLIEYIVLLISTWNIVIYLDENQINISTL